MNTDEAICVQCQRALPPGTAYGLIASAPCYPWTPNGPSRFLCSQACYLDLYCPNVDRAEIFRDIPRGRSVFASVYEGFTHSTRNNQEG